MSSPTANYEPTPRPGDNQDGSITAGSEQSYTTSSASFNWRVTAFTLLWLLFLGLLLFVLLVSFCKRNGKQQKEVATLAPAPAVALSKDSGEQGTNNIVVAEEIVDEQLVMENSSHTSSSSNNNNNNKNSSKSSLFIIYLIMAFSLLVALSFSIIVHTTCEYVGVDENPDFISLGLWSATLPYSSRTNTGGEGVCYNYGARPADEQEEEEEEEDLQIDGAFQVARVAGILSTTVGGILIMVALVAKVVGNYSDTVATRMMQQVVFRPWLGLAFLVVAACQILTLFLASTDECATSECGFQLGAVSAVTATAYWLLGAVTVFVVS